MGAAEEEEGQESKTKGGWEWSVEAMSGLKQVRQEGEEMSSRMRMNVDCLTDRKQAMEIHIFEISLRAPNTDI